MASPTTTTLPPGSYSYYEGLYDNNNFSIQPYLLSDPKVAGLAYYKGNEYAIYANPTDGRCYRSIIRHVNNGNMYEAINRDTTLDENVGLHLTTALVVEVFKTKFKIVQTFMAGNNAHTFDKEKRITYLGHDKEACYPHCHVVPRGDSQTAYIGNVPLRGPDPKITFDMSGNIKGQPGNDAKYPWNEGNIHEMVQIVQFMKTGLDELKGNFAELGLTVITA